MVETGGPGENHWPVASYWQTLSHHVGFVILSLLGGRHGHDRKEVGFITTDAPRDRRDRDLMVVGF
jgi:hypothetical protein